MRENRSCRSGSRAGHAQRHPTMECQHARPPRILAAERGAVRIGLLGTLAVHDEAGRPVRVGGYRVRMLLILLALDVGRVVPAYSLIERLWEDEPPANSGNALQSLVSRLRTALRQAAPGDQVIESHPAGYRLALAPDRIDAVAFEAQARDGGEALASGDAVTARWILREALGAWRGPALADVSAARFASGPAARLEELRTGATLDLVEAGLALGEGDSLVGELRAMIAADPVAERPRGLRGGGGGGRGGGGRGGGGGGGPRPNPRRGGVWSGGGGGGPPPPRLA